MDLKFSRKDLLTVVIVMALTPLVMLAFEMPFGFSLFFLCFMLGFFSVFGYAWMFYDQGKRGSSSVFGSNTFESYKAYLPKLFLILSILGVIGLVLYLLGV